MRRTHRNLALRLPQHLRAALEAEGAPCRRSLTSVVEGRLELALAKLPVDAGPALWRRQDNQVHRLFLALSPELVERLEPIARQQHVALTDVGYNLLMNSLEIRDLTDSAIAA
jgi:hypothetical protein